jgi:hypothetical protein
MVTDVEERRMQQGKTRHRRFAGLARAAAIVVTLAAAGPLASTAGAVPPPPGAEFGIDDFITEVKDRDGANETRAGAHPHSARAEIKFTSYDPLLGKLRPVDEPRHIITRLPPGFSGNPQAAEACPVPLVAFEQRQGYPSACPQGSWVGIIRLDGNVDVSQPVVNVVPEPGFPAEFGFTEVGQTYMMYPELRSESDFGLNVEVPRANVNGITRVDMTFCSWGVVMTHLGFVSGTSTYRCLEQGEPGALERPFLTNPASECPDAAPFTELEVDSWGSPGQYVTKQAISPLITACDSLEFEPSVEIAPSTSAPDAPSGLDVDMAFPQEDNAQGQAPPALKKAVVTLPEGMSINPSAANGLAACADGELMLKSKEPMRCPEASKIGSVKAVSPLLDEPVSGGVYIRSQNSTDPGSGEMFRLALVLQNKERGIDVRLPGQVRVDAATGRIETTFDNNPELPVSSIELDLKGGPRAPLATPPTCGSKTIDTVLTSWGGQTVKRSSAFNVDCAAGLGGFAPAFTAGTVTPIAGAFSPFAVHIDKADRDSALNGVSLKMPTGLLAQIKGNLNTQVGSVRAFAGPGSQPFMLPGSVTLEGAYGDAPYSLRVVVPAKAGPFDLGDVTVRQKVYVDPNTAEVSVVSDPVPTIVKGVPARLQRLDVSVDKPGFMINPTSCEARQISGTLGAATGQTAAVNARFKVGECAKLAFEPDLALRMTGRKQIVTGRHPGVRAQVKQTGLGEAGIEQAKVVLPKSLALDPDNARALCEFEAGTKPDLENHCPKGSIVGRARAKTPLLERDLVGNVYFVKNVRKDAETGNEIRTLPMIIVALRGEIAINLTGESSTTKNGRLINTFANVPDAPITQFNLNIKGGKNGILTVTRTRKAKINICAKPKRHIAQADIDGHNGKVSDYGIRLKTPCTRNQTRTAKRKAKRAAKRAKANAKARARARS